MKPYYEDEAVTLWHGDCLDVLPTIGDVDLVVTSPPYNLGTVPCGGSRWNAWKEAGDRIGYDEHDDEMGREDYRRWQQRCLSLMWHTLSPSGAIFYNHKPRIRQGVLWTPLDLNPGLPLRQIIIWTRAGGMNFTPMNYMPTHEWILVFAQPAWRLKSRAVSGLGDVWHIPQAANPDHPAPFPVGLPARAIESAAPSLVLDPFAGSGTTLRAAKDAGVRSIGIEKSERYCEVIAKRMQQQVLDFGALA